MRAGSPSSAESHREASGDDVSSELAESMLRSQRVTVGVVAGLIALCSLILIARVATRVVGGDFVTPIPLTAQDEIGRFEERFEQFRQVFLSILSEAQAHADAEGLVKDLGTRSPHCLVDGPFVDDESILVVVLVLGMAAMIVAIVWYQRGKEARLDSQTEIEIPIDSTLRSLLVFLPSIAAGPVLVAALSVAIDPWPRQHALAATLIGIGVGAVGLFLGLRASRRFRRIGVLRYTPVSLDLELGPERWRIDLNQPFELDEASAPGPAHARLQVLLVSQGNSRWGFSYMLPMTREPYGDRALDRYLTPLLNGETYLIHDRLRARLRSSATGEEQ